ncbi:MAG: AmmeMemoRadiSam system protein A [Pseudomonadota bacterium]|nr:AmmeMemoRadiSam system protein A [Gammaproteobacteria bacterium]MBU1558618.1 AmmeMemoRadiSam system protein A [Gammaproteobacteria bacterium]MBU1629348.1 AmmeMemoRadiSam system protein A [Gammaproteobacteria bacterium]MBU1926625.1 AmmeMemoRadiSam system protein A [Gammaproteobacteria bacterium]MBU2545808.1 AmmeMemoRadiSam system protein A [Gammaproteobacteria bacterium]
MHQEYAEQDRKILLKLAKDSIQYALSHHAMMDVTLDQLPEKLHETRASFVTLLMDHSLRGCIGSLIAYQPLALDVVKNAYSAAFSDPRFPAVSLQEVDRIEIHISVLSALEPISFESEEDLIRQLRPGVDGLVLTEQGMKGTFLPSVWESLPKPKNFLQHLKLKAGLPLNYWSNTITVERYTTESIEYEWT